MNYIYIRHWVVLSSAKGIFKNKKRFYPTAIGDKSVTQPLCYVRDTNGAKKLNSSNYVPTTTKEQISSNFTITTARNHTDSQLVQSTIDTMLYPPPISFCVDIINSGLTFSLLIRLITLSGLISLREMCAKWILFIKVMSHFLNI